MTTTKHSYFNFRRIAVLIFFLLNCLFATAPYVQAMPVTITASSLNSAPVQQQDTDQEENNLLHYQKNQRQFYQLTERSKKNMPDVTHQPGIYNRYAETYNTKAANSLARSTGLTRPSYYTFLSLYHLF